MPSLEIPEHVKPFPLNVVVVGAGIAGLTTAVALRKNGYNVQVCQQMSRRSLR